MRKYGFKIIFMALLIVVLECFSNANVMADRQNPGYQYWNAMGIRAGKEAFALMKQKGISPKKEDLIVLTNAGYAEIESRSTMGFIDGLVEITGAHRGHLSLLEIHSRYDAPLWCAVYDKASGYCAYLQLKRSGLPASFSKMDVLPVSDTFEIAAVETIRADQLYAAADTYTKKFSGKIFGGNEFRIISIANAVAEDIPAYAVRAFEFHDHYCPGVTSGLLLVNFLKKHFPLNSSHGNYFVQSVQPWCKEDALITLLNATPGKGGYAVLYFNEADRASWKREAKNAATIVYRQDSKTQKWDGIVLGLKWADNVCPDYGKGSIITKLCQDLWYLKRLNQPEDFVNVVRRFELPQGQTPKDWARPGVDPMKRLGLAE
jgi:formylmethanofuran dehydrogenase subunit E-like metal-binding protein